MASTEKEKCLEIGMKMYDDEPHKCHTSENCLIVCLKTTLKTVGNLFGGILIVSYLISSSFCMLREDISRAHFTSALLAGAGLSCVILGLFSSKFTVTGGSRLGYLVCAVLFLNQPSQICPGCGDVYAMGPETRTLEWQMRFQAVQGGVLLVSIVQILIGLTGFDYLVKFIRPVSISPTMILLGIFVMKTCAPTFAGGCWKLFTFTCLLIFLTHFISKRFSNYANGQREARMKIGLRHELFISLLAVILVWMLCAVFSSFEWLRLKNAARTDVYDGALSSASPFKLPYMFQWGFPKFKFNSFFIMLPAVYISVFEVLANYYIMTESELDRKIDTTNKRGKLNDQNIWSTFLVLEGVLSTIIGSMAPGLSASVDLKSRNQMLSGIISGTILIVAATSGIFCALMTTIPEPIVAAFIFLIFLSVSVEGFNLFQCFSMNSTRNHYVLGISLFFGLLVPEFVKKVSYTELFGNPWIDEVFWSILSTEFLIGGIVAVIIDNLADVFVGSDADRNLTVRRNKMTESSSDSFTDESPSTCNCLLSLCI